MADTKQKESFQSLAPCSEVKLGIYKNAFDFVFSNEGVRNVAISGGYGVGKTSLLESYKKSEANCGTQEKKYIHISLAHFDELDTSGTKATHKSILEKKIINQLLHQINPEDIPQTNFKVKGVMSNQKRFQVRNSAFCFALSSLYLYYFDFLKSSVNEAFSFLFNPGFFVFALIILTLCIPYLLYQAISWAMNFNLTKIDFKGSSIETSNDAEESYFDKYLNEVVYVFQNSQADVIVFEDIDRYDSNKIFARLREINFLINNAHKC